MIRSNGMKNSELHIRCPHSETRWLNDLVVFKNKKMYSDVPRNLMHALNGAGQSVQ